MTDTSAATPTPIGRRTVLIATGATPTWAVPLAYALLTLAGIGWALILRRSRPHVYAGIGLGARSAGTGFSFRDTTLQSPTKGDWVAWVGAYDDIVKGKEGQYRVRLMDNHQGSDCAYPGVEVLPDGKLRQKPGPNNSLGRVKFRFPNKHDVYMHDTPERHLFNGPSRTFSHGCMRVQNPVRLAEVPA